MTKDEQKEVKSKYEMKCPECDDTNIFFGGSCPVCYSCGWSKCG